MADELTDHQIALLCDIGGLDQSNLTVERKADLERLIAEGYIEAGGTQPTSILKLTAKGNEFLSVRGAGLNEA